MFNLPFDAMSTYTNLLASSATLLALLYIGKRRPSWRGDLFGILTVLLARIFFYSTAIYLSSPPDGTLHVVDFSVMEMSRLNSLLESFIFLAYAIVWATRVRM